MGVENRLGSAGMWLGCLGRGWDVARGRAFLCVILLKRILYFRMWSRARGVARSERVFLCMKVC